jgi:DNA/RNA endonuclease YhcR with UshA esterase domain
MIFRKAQSLGTIMLRIPLLRSSGVNATGVDPATMSVALTAPDGSAVASFTAPTITEPQGDGFYQLQFAVDAAEHAFVEVDQVNPYTVTLSSTANDVEPFALEVWIVSRYPNESTDGDADGDTMQEIFVLDDHDSPLEDVSVVIRNADNTAAICGDTTDNTGRVACTLKKSSTYKILQRKTGYQFTTPETLVVTGAAATFSGTYIPPQATVVGKQVLRGTFERLTGGSIARAKVYVATKDKNSVVQGAIQSTIQEVAEVTDDGFFEILVTKGARVTITIEHNDSIAYERTVTVTGDDMMYLEDYS